MHSKPYPQQVSLEISNCCNLKCPICPLFQGSDRMNRHKRPPQYMSYDLFSALAEQIASWPTLPDNIFLNMFGEPLMDNGLERKMRRLQDLGLSGRVHLQTNATLLDQTTSEMLLETGLGALIPCMDSLVPGTFAAIRYGASLETVKKNTLRFAELRNATHSSTRITLQYVRTKKNLDDYHAVYTLFSDVLNENDTLWITTSHFWASPSLCDQDLLLTTFSPHRCHNTCDALQTTLIILTDGIVPSCCFDYNIDNSCMGNATTTPLLDIWQSVVRKNLLDAIQKGKELPYRCQHCNMLFSTFDKYNLETFHFSKNLVSAGHHGAVVKFGREV